MLYCSILSLALPAYWRVTPRLHPSSFSFGLFFFIFLTRYKRGIVYISVFNGLLICCSWSDSAPFFFYLDEFEFSRSIIRLTRPIHIWHTLKSDAGFGESGRWEEVTESSVSKLSLSPYINSNFLTITSLCRFILVSLKTISSSFHILLAASVSLL